MDALPHRRRPAARLAYCAGAACLCAAFATACGRTPRGSVPDGGHHSTQRAAADASRDAVAGDSATLGDAGGPADASVDAADVPRPRRVTITATGDIVLHPAVVRVAQAHRGEGRLAFVLAAVAPLISSRVIAFANLETPLTDRFRPPDRGRTGILGAPGEFARDLARIGFDVLQVANNHAYDQTGDGLYETLEALRAAGIEAAGAGPTDDIAYAAHVIERDGIRVAFLGFTMRTNDGPGRNHHDERVARAEDAARALAAITAAREGNDLVAVGIHWSRDRVPNVDDGDRALARRMVDAGADLVLGTGTGLLQRVDRMDSPRGHALVAFSLGTLVSAHGNGYRVGMTRAAIAANPILNDPAVRDGVLLHATFDLSTPDTIRISSAIANAVWTTHADEEFRVIPLRGTDERIRSERLRAVAQALGPAVRVRP